MRPAAPGSAAALLSLAVAVALAAVLAVLAAVAAPHPHAARAAPAATRPALGGEAARLPPAAFPVARPATRGPSTVSLRMGTVLPLGMRTVAALSPDASPSPD